MIVVLSSSQGQETVMCRFIRKVGSPQTKFHTDGSAGVMVICFVFLSLKRDVWASAFQISLHWSQGLISLCKDNHFLFCLLSCGMEEGAAEVGESQMGITLTFEEGKANKSGGEGNSIFQFKEFFLPLYLLLYVPGLNDRRLVNRREKNRQSNDIFRLHITEQPRAGWGMTVVEEGALKYSFAKCLLAFLQVFSGSSDLLSVFIFTLYFTTGSSERKGNGECPGVSRRAGSQFDWGNGRCRSWRYCMYVCMYLFSFR